MMETIWIANTNCAHGGSAWRAFRGEHAARAWVAERRRAGLADTYMVMMMMLA